MGNGLSHFLTRVGELTAHRYAFLVVIIYGVSWMIFEPEKFDWHAVATLSAVMMTFFIQRAAHRDTQALHAKIDVLLRVEREADNTLTRLDDAQPEEIAKYREKNADEGPKKRWDE
jgi:low affinity Fe/Cu permease